MAASALDPGRYVAGVGDSGGWQSLGWLSPVRPAPLASIPEGLDDTLSWGAVPRRHYALRAWNGDRMEIDAEGKPPAWLEPVLAELRELLRLPPDWNSYRARPIAARAALAAIELLLQAMPEGLPLPAIVPTVRGGVQLEWHRRGVDLEIEALPDGRYSVAFEDERSGRSWEYEGVPDIEPAKAALAELGGR